MVHRDPFDDWSALGLGNPMRLGFQYFGNQLWGGGNYVLENFFRGLRALGPDCPHLTLVADQAQAPADYADLVPFIDAVLPGPVRVAGNAQQIAWSLRGHLAWWLRRRLWRGDTEAAPHPLSEFLLRHNIEAFCFMPWTEAIITRVPLVAWLPDFQHVHLPELYSPEDRASRDRQFRAQARAASRLLVKSDAVLQDLTAFIPQDAAKARCVDFVAFIPPETYAEDPRPGLAAYHLPEKFIYLPNQFWQHKNHKLVFEALARLAARGVHPTIVSTGNPLDYRRPAYFSELMQLLSRANLRDQFIILGQVPRADVFRLIRQAVCVLNPSRFEGFGMSVAESKSLGKRVLASDIGPLREQAAPGAVYFDPADVDDLAAKLETAWLSLAPGPDLELEAAARAALPGRQAQFGRALLQVFSEAQAAFDN